MKKILIIVTNYILNIIFPKSKTADRLSNMSSDEFYNTAGKVILKSPSFIFPIFNYKDKLVQESIWELKYFRNNDAIRIFSELLYKHIVKNIDLEKSGRALLIPVPMHKGKERDRGYNQCKLICEAIEKIDCRLKLVNILKKRKTKSQNEINNRQKRLSNLNNAFYLNESAEITDDLYIIIDDVLTTGSTIKEVRKVLKNGGAKNIIAFTIAH